MITIPAELQEVLVSTPDTLHGAIRFKGTRVFAYQLFDYLLGGHSIDQFLDDFEGVTREQAETLANWELKRVRAQFEQAS